VLGDGGEDIAEVLFAPCPVVDVLVEEGERDVGRLPHELLLPGGVVVGVVLRDTLFHDAVEQRGERVVVLEDGIRVLLCLTIRCLRPGAPVFRNPCHAWSRNFSRIVFLIVF